MQNFIVIANVADWGWNEDDFLKQHPEIYGPRLVEDVIRARTETEAFFRMKDRNPMCLVDIVEIRQTDMEIDYVPKPGEDEDFYRFLYGNHVT